MGWFDQAQPPLPLPVMAAQLGQNAPTWSMGRPPAMPPDNSAPMPQFPAPDAGQSVPMYPPGERPPGQFLPPGVSAQIPQQAPAQPPQPGFNAAGQRVEGLPLPGSAEWKSMSQEEQMKALDAVLASQEEARRNRFQPGGSASRGWR
jgi:hypothetical protein